MLYCITLKKKKKRRNRVASQIPRFSVRHVCLALELHSLLLCVKQRNSAYPLTWIQVICLNCAEGFWFLDRFWIYISYRVVNNSCIFSIISKISSWESLSQNTRLDGLWIQYKSLCAIMEKVIWKSNCNFMLYISLFPCKICARSLIIKLFYTVPN